MYTCGVCEEKVDKSKLEEHIAREHNTDSLRAKQIVGDPKVILTLTADLTDALKSIPVPEEKIINDVEKQSKLNLLSFMNNEYQTPLKGTNDGSDFSDDGRDIKERDYIKEVYPKNEENNEAEFQGVTYKGKSRKYINAYNRLKEKLVKGSEFKVKGNCLRVKETPKGKPMKVELSNEGGDKGEAQIQMYKPGKKEQLF